jgi:thiol-disulfide isomerase/thioredoxin
MKTSIALHNNGLKSALSAAVVACGLAFGIQTTHATVATNFTIINHATSQPLSLYDYQGSVIVLDFWAYWCDPCKRAALDIEPNITQYYRNAGGNSNGVPVQVISVNIDCGSLTSENSYIQECGLELVGDDCSWVAYNQFDHGGIPQFAVINGATNSLNCTPWQILSEPTGYATNYTVPLLLKTYIDSVQTPAPISTVTNPVNGAVIAPSNIPLGAKITTNGKIIKKVEFYNGATLLGSTTNKPYSLIWSNVSVGAKSVIARAYYGASSSANSAAVNFTVATPVVARVSKQGTNLLLSWTGGTGNYQVQIATNLAGAVWQACGTAGTNTSLVITRSNRAAFYRVRWP